MFVAGTDQRFSNRRSPITDRQRFPVLCFRLRNEPVELVLSFEHSAERQTRFGRYPG
jgi:hypothetical protein